MPAGRRAIGLQDAGALRHERVVQATRGLAWGAALLVAALAALPTVLSAARSELLFPDAVEFLAIANAWVHGAGVLAGYALIHALMLLTTGLAPYEGYGFMMEMLSDFSPRSYRKEYVGAATFVWRHLDAVLGLIGRNAEGLARCLFALPRYSYVGWVALPGSVYCVLFPRGDAERAGRLRLAGLATCSSRRSCAASLSATERRAVRPPWPRHRARSPSSRLPPSSCRLGC